MSIINRRDILGRPAVVSAAGALTVPMLAHGVAHPDAELLQAGRRWQARTHLAARSRRRRLGGRPRRV